MAKQTIGQRQQSHAGNIHMRDQKHRRHLGACYDPHCMDDVVPDIDAIAPMRGFVIAMIIIVVTCATATLTYAAWNFNDTNSSAKDVRATR